MGGIRVWSEAGAVDEGLVALCEEILDALPDGDSAGRAMVAARLAGELYFLPEASDRRRALTDDAVAMARRLDDPAVLALVLGGAHWGTWVPGTARERLAIAEEILQLGRAAGDRALQFSGAQWAFSDLMELGDTERADEMLATEMTIAAELNRPDLLWIAGVHRCTRVLMEGRYDNGAQLADEALAYGQAAHIETALQMYGVAHIDIARARGGVEELEPLVAGMVEQYPLLPAWRTGLIYLNAMLDRPDDVREQVEILAADDFADLPTDANWGIAVALLIFGCAVVGDQQRAARLYEMLLPYGEYFVIAGLPAISTDRSSSPALSRNDRPPMLPTTTRPRWSATPRARTGMDGAWEVRVRRIARAARSSDRCTAPQPVTPRVPRRRHRDGDDARGRSDQIARRHRRRHPRLAQAGGPDARVTWAVWWSPDSSVQATSTLSRGWCGASADVRSSIEWVLFPASEVMVSPAMPARSAGVRSAATVALTAMFAAAS
jgi:hypothetical protein